MKLIRVFLLFNTSWCCFNMPMEEPASLIKNVLALTETKVAGIAFCSTNLYAMASINEDLSSDIVVCEVNSKKAAKKIINCPGQVTSLCMAHNLKKIALGLQNKIVILDIETGQFKEYKAHAARVNSITAHSKFPDLLLSGSDDKSIKMWDLRSPIVTNKIDYAHEGPVTTVQMAGQEHYFLSCSQEITKRWDWHMLQTLNIIKGISSRGVEYNLQSDRFMIFASHVNRYHATSVALMATFNRRGEQEPLRGSKIGISPAEIYSCSSTNKDEHELMAIGSGISLAKNEGKIALCYPEDPKAEPLLFAPFDGPVDFLAFSPDGDYLVAAAQADKKMQVYQLPKKLSRGTSASKRPSIKGCLGLE